VRFKLHTRDDHPVGDVGSRARPVGRRSRTCAALLLALTGLLIFAGSSIADTATISVLNTAGEPDAAAFLPRVFTVSGSASLQEGLYIKHRAPGGAPCAPTADSDSGQWFDYYDPYGDRGDVNGTFSESDTLTWETPGLSTFCIWLVHGNAETITTPITQTIDFRSPTGTITASVNPTVPKPNEQASVTVTGSSEAPAQVYAKLRRAGGAPCAPTYESDSGGSLIDGNSVNGSFSISAKTAQTSAGEYLICLWLARSSNDSAPIAGPQPETFVVVAPPPPPPPCVVPQLSARTSLSTIEQRIRSAACSLGRVRSLASRTVPRGDVTALTPSSGTTLANGSAIGVTVSSGPPCVVPRAVLGATLTTARQRLASAHCSTGAVSYLRTRRHRRGVVLATDPRPGSSLPTGASVRLRVSRR
jgi:hypothetical protein